jgi:hypothetical protein
MRSLMICNSHPLLSGDEIEKKEMGSACRAIDGGERRIEGFSGKI